MANVIVACSVVISITFCLTMPAFSQNRFMDEARERAERHKENDAIRRAEHPETAQPAAAPIIAAPAEAVTTQLVNVLDSAKVPARAE